MSSKKYKEKIISLRKEGKTYNDICKILKCAKSTVSFHCKKENLSPKKIEIIKINDEISLDANNFYKENTLKNTISYINNKYGKISEKTIRTNLEPKNKTKKSSEQKKIDARLSVKKFRKKIRLKVVDYLGGKCSICGYNKCIDALHAHHMDMDKKKFGISARGYTNSWDKIKDEVDKCILLCANCHAEVHSVVAQR